jgi:cyclophilin family peptidyl-prolyl cis-trans isomerase
MRLILVLLALVSALFLAACGAATQTALTPTVVPGSDVAAPIGNLPSAVTDLEGTRTPADWCAAASPAPEPSGRSYAQPEQVLLAGVDYRAIICTEGGPLYIDLYEGYSPIAVNSFVFLAERGFYNNTTFHRVLRDFMAQGGDPTGTGTGGPGYQFPNESLGFLNFDEAGVLAMANAGRDTNGSQFFITTAAAPHLGYNYTIFGGLLEGDARTIRLRDPDTATTPGARLDTVIIITDPSTVETGYTPPTAPSGAEIRDALAAAQALITPEVAETLGLQISLQTTEEALTAEPEAGQAALGEWLGAHGHAFRVKAVIENLACNFELIDFANTTYTLDAFSSKAEAAAALEDPAQTNLASAEGYGEPLASDDLPGPYYLRNHTVCDQPVVTAMTRWQRERFVATVSITFPASNTELVPALPQILNQGVGLTFFEPLLAKVFLREMAQG